ncbi:MAG: ABC transporter permease [Terriglobales bacterium]
MRFNWRSRREREIADELAAHAALRAEASQAAGMDPRDAARDAARRLGSDLALRERTRLAGMSRSAIAAEALGRDLRLAARSLRRRPGFSLLAIATLALGIGATTAMFSAVRAVLLDTLPFPHPERLVMVQMTGTVLHRTEAFDNVPLAAYRALRQSGVFAQMGISGYNPAESTVYVDGLATDANVMQASPGLFPTLGARFELGHNLTGGPQVVISDRFWRHQLHADPAALGRPLQVGDSLYTVAGVLAAGQAWPPSTDVWQAGLPSAGNDGRVVARLRAGTPVGPALHRAQAAVAAIGHRPGLLPNSPDVTGLVAATLRRQLARPPARTALWVLLAAAACLLLIAALNTANLLLARGLGRRHEFAVRRVLGASRTRLASQALAEGALLAALGGAAGVALAALAVKLARLGPASLPRLAATRLDASSLAVALSLTCAAGLGAALAPALRAARGVQPRPTLRLRAALIVIEVALTLALLVGGTLLATSFNRLWRRPLGFNPQQVVSLDMVAPKAPTGRSQGARLALWQRRSQLDQRALAAVRALPGIISAGYSNHEPFDFTNGADFMLPGQQLKPGPGQEADWIEAGLGYFTTLQVPLLAGRDFSAADLDSGIGAPQPIIVNQAMAEKYWPKAPAVGQRLQAGRTQSVVVGVVANMHDVAMAAPQHPQAFTPMAGGWGPDATLLVRSAQPLGALSRELRRTLHAQGLGMSQPVTLAAAQADALAEPRFRTALLSLYAALAFALALVGLYGVLALEVRERTHELAVRVALGADRPALVRLVLSRGVRLIALGLALGCGLAWLLSASLASLLFQTPRLDPLAWTGALLALALAALLAGWLPARRAARVDAARMLRWE